MAKVSKVEQYKFSKEVLDSINSLVTDISDDYSYILSDKESKGVNTVARFNDVADNIPAAVSNFDITEFDRLQNMSTKLYGAIMTGDKKDILAVRDYLQFELYPRVEKVVNSFDQATINKANGVKSTKKNSMTNSQWDRLMNNSHN